MKTLRREFKYKEWTIHIKADSEGFHLMSEHKVWPSYETSCGPGQLQAGIKTFKIQLDHATKGLESNMKELHEVDPNPPTAVKGEI